MRRVAFAFVLGFLLAGGFARAQFRQPALAVQDDGTPQGLASTINCGANVACSVTGAVATITAAGGTGGTIAIPACGPTQALTGNGTSLSCQTDRDTTYAAGVGLSLNPATHTFTCATANPSTYGCVRTGIGSGLDADKLQGFTPAGLHVGSATNAENAMQAEEAGNADKLDGLHATDLSPLYHAHAAADVSSGLLELARIPQGAGSGLNADKIDGFHATTFAQASHQHDASFITSGILDLDRLPHATSTTSGYLDADTYNDFDAKIGSLYAGDGLFAEDWGGHEWAVGLAPCDSAGQVWKWNGSYWACAADEDTKVLPLSNGGLSAFLNTLSLRACGVGGVLKSTGVDVTGNGQWACGTDVSVDDYYGTTARYSGTMLAWHEGQGTATPTGRKFDGRCSIEVPGLDPATCATSTCDVSAISAGGQPTAELDRVLVAVDFASTAGILPARVITRGARVVDSGTDAALEVEFCNVSESADYWDKPTIDVVWYAASKDPDSFFP